MKILLIASVIFLTACSTVPVSQKFPEAPDVLLTKCDDLKRIEAEAVDIVDLLKVVVKNYGSYHECAAKQAGWIEWYKKQKDIFERLNK